MKTVKVAKYSQLQLSSNLNFQDALFFKVAFLGKLIGENLFCCFKPSHMEPLYKNEIPIFNCG